MSRARIVPVVVLAWKAEARVLAARVRLNAIAAQTSQALLRGQKCPAAWWDDLTCQQRRTVLQTD